MMFLFGSFIIAAAIYHATQQIVEAIDSLAISIEGDDDDEVETEVWRGGGD